MSCNVAYHSFIVKSFVTVFVDRNWIRLPDQKFGIACLQHKFTEVLIINMSTGKIDSIL